MSYMYKKLKSVLGLGFALASSKFKLRNEGSYLGIFWYLLSPLFMFIVLLKLFSKNVGAGIPSYPVYLILGLVMFSFFRLTTSQASSAIYENGQLIKSVKLPLVSFSISAVFQGVFSHIFEVLLIGGFLLWFGTSLKGLLFYPLVLILFGVFSLGVSLVLSTLGVFIVDLKNLWAIFLNLLWFATPVFYTLRQSSPIFLMNPVAFFITIGRDVVIYHQVPELWILMGAIFYSFLALFFGLVVFALFNKKLAERV